MGRGGVDILIFPAEAEASDAIKAVGTEAGTRSAQSGGFVDVSVEPTASNAVVTALERWETEAEP
jgi:hypothetical protein